jgi:hypothetical protein
VTHYEVLGVARQADDAEIRRAYLDLARRHHPDAAGGDAEEMLRVNEAWAVLGDPASRARYDAGLDPDVRSFAHRPNAAPFVPFDTADDESDDWRYEPDVGDPRTAPGRRVLMAPMVCLWLAAAAFGVWLVSPGRALIVLAAVLAAVSVVGFLAAPIVAMAKASQYERRG